MRLGNRWALDSEPEIINKKKKKTYKVGEKEVVKKDGKLVKKDKK